MKLLLLFIFMLTQLCSLSQQPHLYFEKITTEHGLSHNKVNCILQDQKGFIWFGTDDGLNRYDGKNFLQFHHHSSDPASISGNIITDLLEDKEGLLWIATADGGLNAYDSRLPPQKQFRKFLHNPSNPRSLPSNSINALVEDEQGMLWLATTKHSVLRFNRHTGEYQPVTGSRKTVIELAVGKNGMIWAGRQGGGILKINPRNLQYHEDIRYADLYAKLPHATVTSLYLDAEKNMWFGSWDKVLYRHNANTEEESVFRTTGPFSFQNDEILCFQEDKEGRLWMGGRNKGLHIYSPSENKFFNYQYDPTKEGSLAGNRVNCIVKDRQGNMWLATDKGVCMNNPNKQQFVQNFLHSQSRQPVTVYDFLELENGRLLIGTSHGLFIREANGTMQQQALTYKNQLLQVTSFYKDKKGIIYLGSNYSLFIYHPLSNTVRLLPNTEKDSVMNGIIDSRVVSIVPYELEGERVLLVAPYGHFMTYYKLEDKKWVSRLDTSRKIISRFRLTDNLIRKFYKTKNGKLWMATASEGLGVWLHPTQPETVYFSKIAGDPTSVTNNNISDMIEDRKGNLWVSTFGGGLHYFHTDAKKFVHIKGSNNLLEGLQLDDRGNVWMISNGNLHRYNPERKQFHTYDLPDQEKEGGIYGNIFKDRHGNFFVAGKNYFISFHPDSIREHNPKPQVFFTNFSVFNQSFSHFLQQEKIALRHYDNYFSFEFSAPYFAPGNVVYSYKLEGFDKDWIDAGSRNYASYSNLEGGQYRFRVRASLTPGVWSNDDISMPVRIIPPFWKTSWFYMLCLVVLAAVLFLLYRYRMNEMMKRQEIRNKIAQDLHDNVGSTLSSISIFGKVAKIYHQQQRHDHLQHTLEKISEASGDMIAELSDTVWAINPRNDNMQVMLQRMESFARPLLLSENIQLHFQYPPSIAHLNLSMEKRRNFYLFFKEVVNNTIKYSGATNFFVSVEKQRREIVLHLHDDGKGFNLIRTKEWYQSADVTGGGNGLRNLQLRAKEMQGQVIIDSVPGKGTRTELRFLIT